MFFLSQLRVQHPKLSVTAEAEIQPLIGAIVELPDLGHSNLATLHGPCLGRLAVTRRHTELILTPAAAGTATVLPLPHDAEFLDIATAYQDFIRRQGPYHHPVGTMASDQMMALDAGRRSLHNQGAEYIQTAWAVQAEFSFAAARAIFALVSALHHYESTRL